LSRAEVERMEKEALEFAQQDHAQKELIDAKIKGDSLVMDAEKSLAQWKGQIEDRYLDNVSRTLEAAKVPLPANPILR